MENKTFQPVQVVWNGKGKETLCSEEGRKVFVVARGEGTKIIDDFHGFDLSLKQELPNVLDYLKFVGEGLTPDNIILDEVDGDLHITFQDPEEVGKAIPNTEVILKNTEIEDIMFCANNLEEWCSLIMYDGEEEDDGGIIITKRDKKGFKTVKSVNKKFNCDNFQIKWLQNNDTLAKKIRINTMREYGHVIYGVFEGAEAPK